MAQQGTAWNVAVFAVGGRTIDVGHILAAAHCRGEVLEVWNTVLGLVAAEKDAAALVERDEAEVDDEQLQSLSEQFRYDRDLITAEDTERWLAARRLTFDDFNAHFLRHYWVAALDEVSEPDAIDYLSAPDALCDVLIAELMFSGELERMAERLSWRFAAAGRRGDDPPPTGRVAPLAGDGVALEAWLARLGCDPQWLGEVQLMEAAYQRHREQLLTAEEIARSLASMRLALTRVELETVDVDSPDAVRELALCVQEDGMTMAEVAADGRYSYQRTETVLEDLPADVQQKVLSASPGDVLPPRPHDDGFHVDRLIARSDPDPTDQEVRARVEHQLLTRHFSALAAGCVRWLLAPNPEP